MDDRFRGRVAERRRPGRMVVSTQLATLWRIDRPGSDPPGLGRANSSADELGGHHRRVSRADHVLLGSVRLVQYTFAALCVYRISLCYRRRSRRFDRPDSAQAMGSGHAAEFAAANRLDGTGVGGTGGLDAEVLGQPGTLDVPGRRRGSCAPGGWAGGVFSTRIRTMAYAGLVFYHRDPGPAVRDSAGLCPPSRPGLKSNSWRRLPGPPALRPGSGISRRSTRRFPSQGGGNIRRDPVLARAPAYCIELHDLPASAALRANADR